eukprot:Lithocolla_globosa_v1_NODE_5629_length_1208_cov_3.771899.p1 type:complete len:384 gc:universal NODE_5629_length_1208_cov_3.771899:50-1201(+)
MKRRMDYKTPLLQTNQDGAAHLVVFVHGFMGNKSHMQYLVDQVCSMEVVDASAPRVVVLNSQTNQYFATLDGIDICGKRLMEEIYKATQGSNIKKFSIIGYSMGGLVARYAIGLLHEEDFFESIIPVNFITFATPHLGVRRRPTGVISRFFNKVLSRMGSYSGQQMQVADHHIRYNLPLLVAMSSSETPFLEALKKFRRQTTYANTINDRSVPFCSASIRPSNPFRRQPKALKTKYPHIIQHVASEQVESYEEERILDVATTFSVSFMVSLGLVLLVVLPIFFVFAFCMSFVLAFFAIYSRLKVREIRNRLPSPHHPHVEDMSQTWREEMMAGLNSICWHKVDVRLKTLNSHGAIIVRSRNILYRVFGAGHDVVQHMKEHWQW